MKSQLGIIKMRICAVLENPTRVRYVIAGVWNTFFGYILGLVLYYGSGGQINVVAVGVTGNIISISMAFIIYKLYVFRTKGNWLKEYFRAFLVYGLSGIMGVGLLSLFVDGVGLPFWMGQGMAIVLIVIISYISHSRFTFKSNEVKQIS